MRYSDFWKVEDWQILETKKCYSFNEGETAFNAVNVQVGILTVYKTNINGAVIEKIPITRWITENEYLRLSKYTGVVIF